jgi:predicted transcriptional regulator
MKYLFLGFAVCFSCINISCKKSKTKKQIAGKWLVTEMYTDEVNFLLLKKKGTFYTTICDSMHFERTEKLVSEITFTDNGSYTRKNNITISYLDTAATRAQCKVIYADSVLNNVEEGKWKFEGKETLELIANNKNYEGNKLISISNSAMQWQTDLTVEQGFVLFKGLKTTKFIKQ